MTVEVESEATVRIHIRPEQRGHAASVGIAEPAVPLPVGEHALQFFCDPHSPWQRPSNKHMNGLLRQYYFPKGTDLNLVGLEQVRFLAAEMNGRPRKVLGW